MQHTRVSRSFLLRFVLLPLLLSPLIAPLAWAQTDQAPGIPTPTTLEEAQTQRERAAQMRDESEQRLTSEQAACYQKFLVNSCLSDAKKRYTQSQIDARNWDAPARDFQREAKRADVSAKETQREADRPQREADEQQKAETYRADEAAKTAARDQKIAAKAEKAAKGRQKIAADQAKHQAKLDKRVKQDAERAAKKASKAATE